MAKLSARGRVVVSAWTKTLPDLGPVTKRVYFRSLMSDGNVLCRHSFTLPANDFSPAKRVNKPWTIGWKMCNGQPMPDDISRFDRVMEKQGYQRE